jgi:TonB family protein
MRQPAPEENRPVERALRVAVERGEDVRDVALIRRSGRVTIGRSSNNDIVVNDPEAPRHATLLRLARSGCWISTAPGVGGDVLLDRTGVTFSIDELREASPHPGGQVRVDEHSRGHIDCWGTRVLFQLVDLPVAAGASDPARWIIPAAAAACALVAALFLLARPAMRLGSSVVVSRNVAPIVTPLAAPPASNQTECVGADCGADRNRSETGPGAVRGVEAPVPDGEVADWEHLGKPPMAVAGTSPHAPGTDQLAAGESPKAPRPHAVATRRRLPERSPRLRAGEEFVPDGLLTPRTAALEISRRRGALTSCYERALRREPHLSGRLVVRFTVDETGGVSDLRVVHDTVGDHEMRNDLERILRTWRFPAPSEGRISFSYPFVFRSTDRPRVS